MRAKLDYYNYDILENVIRIFIDSKLDSYIFDIFHELEKCNNLIYIEGLHYTFTGNYQIEDNYLDLHVV